MQKRKKRRKREQKTGQMYNKYQDDQFTPNLNDSHNKGKCSKNPNEKGRDC